MICQRCLRPLRSNEGLKCSVCESQYHSRCVPDYKKDFYECGDRVNQWICAICHNPANRSPDNYSKEHMINAIKNLTEKLDMVKKVHLAKLSGELSDIKSVTDHIVKQNDDILRKIDEFEKKNIYEKRTCRRYRRRSLNFTKISRKSVENNDYMPIPSSTEKPVRYHTRRRPFLLKGMLRLLKRRTNKNNAQNKMSIKSSAYPSNVKSESQPMVSTPLGDVTGYYMKTRGGKQISAFTALPYAAPPLGHLRFKVRLRLYLLVIICFVHE
ncbi:Esterase [Operophtera brumata]|uniref:Esterase n=1 Tax=Operophtera brumata TaxID=104452 RepID=A0A0L7KX31_OPEBR|nr:Esterase [Operophtera brumata]